MLAGSLNRDVYNRLSSMAEPGSDGSYSDRAVRARGRRGLRTINRWRTFYAAIEMLIFGLSQGSVLVLAAIGLAITFGVMGVINMAHGELMMLGAYTDLCGAAADAAAHRCFDLRGDSGRVPGVGAGRRR